MPAQLVPYLSPHASEAELPVNDVVVLYDGLTAAQQAAQSIPGIAAKMEVGRLQPTTWQFSMLGDPAVYRRALRHARRARCLVIASHRQRALTEDVLKWLQACLATPEARGLFVVALGRTSPANLAAIEDLVQQAGATFESHAALAEPI